MIKSLFFTLFAVVVMASCSSAPKEFNIQTLIVGSRLATVDGQKVYIVKKSSMPNHWFYLYSGIEGFTGYQEGYEYELETRVVPRTPTETDVSRVAYVFVKEISKKHKESQGMPGFSLAR